MNVGKIPAIVVFLLSFFILPGSVQAYSGGDGSAGNPFQIATAAELLYLGAHTGDYSAYFILTADIDLSSSGTFPAAVIAPDTDNLTLGHQGDKFTGHFNGNGHTISNLTLNGAGNDYLGLFGYKGGSSEVNNLGLKDVNITGGTGSFYLGGLVGRNNGNVNNCYSTGTVSGGDNSCYLGGLVGYNSNGTISNCYSTGAITGGDNSAYLGGLVGENYNATISNCYSTGAVTGGVGSYDLGGLVGWNDGGIISNCYSIGAVTGTSYLGGLVGVNAGAGSTISNCYSTGTVTGTSQLGGLVGYNTATVTACFWDTETSGQPTSAGGTGKTTVEMKMQSSFSGWDFVGETANGTNDFWAIIEGVDYPKLSALGKYSGGTGTAGDPFQIATVADLLTLATNTKNYDKYFILTANIDLGSSGPFTTAVIAPDTNNLTSGLQGVAFTGGFDGAGHKISNLTINTGGAGNDYLGLFGEIGSGGEVKNLGLENVNIAGEDNSYYLGGMAGWSASGSNIDNCYSTGNISSGASSTHLGGLAGDNDGTISNCYSTGAVNSGHNSEDLGGLVGLGGGTISDSYSTDDINSGDNSQYLGGLLGRNWGGGASISNCYSAGTVKGGGSSQNLGGLIGFNNSGGVSNCYSSGDVNSGDTSNTLGGLVGYNFNATISNCYSMGDVNGGIGSSNLGGLVGESTGTVTACFWDTTTSGQTDSDGGTGKTTVEMKTKSTFTGAGWNFATIWVICEGVDYPELIWAYVYVPLSPPAGVSATDGTYTDHIRVTWSSVSRATAYEVWRSTSNSSGSASKLGDYTSPYDDYSGITVGTTYYYWVKARNSCGTSGFSSSDSGSASATPPSCTVPSAPTGVSATNGAYTDHIRVTWNPVSDATGYKVWRNTSNDSATASPLGVGNHTSPYDDDSGITVGATYYYWVRAENSCGTSDFSSSDSGFASATPCTVPSAPVGVSASDGNYTDHIRVTWNPVSGATDYEVWRSTDSNSGSASYLGDHTLPFDNYGVTAGTTYFYWVKARNSCGTSDLSSSDSGYASASPKSYSVSITKCTVTAGSKDNSDKISISGTMDANADDLSDANEIQVIVYSADIVSPCVQTFLINDKTFKNNRYSYSGTVRGVRKSFKYNPNTGKFSFTAANVNLSGLACPFNVQIKIDDSFGTDQVDEDIVNGPKKPIPILLMMSVKDALRVDSCKVKQGKKKPNTDQLSVKGGFAVKDVDVNMAAGNFVATLDTQTFTIPAGKFKEKGVRSTCSKAEVTEDGSIAAATFNFKTCSFTLTIKNTEIPAISGDVDFRIAFADYNQVVQVTFP